MRRSGWGPPEKDPPWRAPRWRPTSATCFFDLSGGQGLLVQVEGRTADDAAYWLAQAPPAWRDAIQVGAIDMCSSYASAVREKYGLTTASRNTSCPVS
jgi:hypothetical protein